MPDQTAVGQDETYPRPPWLSNTVPQEGENGLFSQTWYPMCRSAELEPGQIRSTRFLDGEVVVWRGYDGTPHVQAAYCLHVGAHLGVGKVMGDAIQCAFHKWEFGGDGRCLRTGIGDPPPKRARLFSFPVVERYGLVWAFNGEEPLWQLPDFAHPDEELHVLVQGPWSFPCDPWVIASNTYDFQHIELLHGFHLQGSYPDKEIQWGPYSIRYPVKFVNAGGQKGDFTFGTLGNNIYVAEGYLDGEWYAYLAPRSLPRPGQCEIYFALMTHKGAGDPQSLAAARALAVRVAAVETAVASQDAPILEKAKFRAGYLTRADRQLAKFFNYLKRYPRAHPAADYIK